MFTWKVGGAWKKAIRVQSTRDSISEVMIIASLVLNHLGPEEKNTMQNITSGLIVSQLQYVSVSATYEGGVKFCGNVAEASFD